MTLAGNHNPACSRSGAFRKKTVHRNVQVGLQFQGDASQHLRLSILQGTKLGQLHDRNLLLEALTVALHHSPEQH